MKKLDSKLFKNNTVERNKMAKFFGGNMCKTQQGSTRDLNIDGVVGLTCPSIDETHPEIPFC